MAANAEHPFPNNPTTDQFFGSRYFEAYVELGRHVGIEIGKSIDAISQDAKYKDWLPSFMLAETETRSESQQQQSTSDESNDFGETTAEANASDATYSQEEKEEVIQPFFAQSDPRTPNPRRKQNTELRQFWKDSRWS